MRKFYYSILFICLFGLGVFLLAGIYLPKDSRSAEMKIFLVEKGEGSRNIAMNLEKAGLITWSPLFRLYVLTKGISNNLQSGAYELKSSMAIPEIAQKMAGGDTLKVKATIPEGFTLKDIEEMLASKLPEIKFDRFSAGNEAKASSSPFAIARVEDFKNEFDFLADAPDAASLEGFLFPDTYHFSFTAGSQEVAGKMLDNFDTKLTPDLREEIKRQGKSIFDIVIMASLLEKEVKTLEDKKLAAGILWKRLKIKMPLQVDSTLNYITGKNKASASISDTKIDSPYNTYKYLGLPAGPISNPGLESIAASVYPESSGYLYYLSTTDGRTIFSKTLAEHNLAKAKYLK